MEEKLAIAVCGHQSSFLSGSDQIVNLNCSSVTTKSAVTRNLTSFHSLCWIFLLLMAHFHGAPPIGCLPAKTSRLIVQPEVPQTSIWTWLAAWANLLGGFSYQPTEPLYVFQCFCFWVQCLSESYKITLKDPERDLQIRSNPQSFSRLMGYCALRGWRCRAPRASSWMISSQDGSGVSFAALSCSEVLWWVHAMPGLGVLRGSLFCARSDSENTFSVKEIFFCWEKLLPLNHLHSHPHLL